MFSKRSWKLVICMILVFSMIFIISGCNKVGNNITPKTGTGTTPSAAFKPDKAITMVVPYAAGGSTDLLARAVEKIWTKYCPQPMTVVNKSAGGGVEGSIFVARSKPDGYTIQISYGSGVDLVMPHIQKVEYDPFKDLEPVARLSIHSVLVAVPANSQFNSMKDVVDWAKKENKPVTAAVSTTAGAVDIVMRGIGKTAGIIVTPIPHAGGSQAITSLVGGQTMIGGGHPTEILSQLKTNRIKPIGIATPDRDPVLKDVPTLKEQGLNFSTWGSVKGIAVPKNTPKEIITYYEDLFKKISEDADYQKVMSDMAQPIQYQNAADFSKFMKQAYDDYGKLIKDLGLDTAK